MADYKRYVHATEVDARQLEEDETVVTASGPQEASAGDYAVRHQDGTVTVVGGDDFEDAYRPAGGDAGKRETSSKGK
jgi:hypothetical protein